ncbi:MAG: hypothetical protein WDN44_09445 [Sphingomonas sp.]
MDGWRLGRKLGFAMTAVPMVGLGIYAAILPFLMGAPVKIF